MDQNASNFLYFNQCNYENKGVLNMELSVLFMHSTPLSLFDEGKVRGESGGTPRQARPDPKFENSSDDALC